MKTQHIFTPRGGAPRQPGPCGLRIFFKVDRMKANQKRSVRPKTMGSEPSSGFWQIVNGLGCALGGEGHATQVFKPIVGAPTVEMLQGKLRHRVRPSNSRRNQSADR